MRDRGKEAEEGRRWQREVIKRKCKREKVKVGTGDVKGMRAEMAGCEKGKRWKQKEEKDGGSDGKDPVFLCKNTKLTLFAEAYSSWMVVTVWKIREWERDGHGRAVKYSGMKIPSLREKRWVCGSPQMCSLDGNGRGLELQKAWQDVDPQVVESIYHSTPPLSTSPPTPPPCSSSTLSASQPFSPSLSGEST